MSKSVNNPKSLNAVLILCSFILLIIIGVSIYFIVDNETSKKKHHHVYPPRARCDHANGYVWSQRLRRCVRGWRN